jgi:hypothetical protein
MLNIRDLDKILNKKNNLNQDKSFYLKKDERGRLNNYDNRIKLMKIKIQI